jgi:hypothetical protein
MHTFTSFYTKKAQKALFFNKFLEKILPFYRVSFLAREKLTVSVQAHNPLQFRFHTAKIYGSNSYGSCSTTLVTATGHFRIL